MGPGTGCFLTVSLTRLWAPKDFLSNLLCWGGCPQGGAGGGAADPIGADPTDPGAACRRLQRQNSWVGGVPGGHRGLRDELRAVETPARTQPTEAGLGATEGPVCPACRRSRDSPVQTRRREKPHAAGTGARAARPSQHGHPASGAEERQQRPLCQREGQSDQEEEQQAAPISGAVAVGWI